MVFIVYLLDCSQQYVHFFAQEYWPKVKLCDGLKFDCFPVKTFDSRTRHSQTSICTMLHTTPQKPSLFLLKTNISEKEVARLKKYVFVSRI